MDITEVEAAIAYGEMDIQDVANQIGYATAIQYMKGIPGVLDAICDADHRPQILVSLVVDQACCDCWLDPSLMPLRFPLLGPGRLTYRSLSYEATKQAVGRYMTRGVAGSILAYLVYRQR